MAALLGYTYIDTGAMYRAVALKALRRKIPITTDATPANEALVALARDTRIDLRASSAEDGGTQRVSLDGEDVTAAIRTAEVSQAANSFRSTF